VSTRLRARGLSKCFGPRQALAPLDLALETGEALAVLGPNGAGKSTLLRLLAGLARPSAGSLEMDGAGADRTARRRAIGLVGHATFLYPTLTARENLVLTARLFGVPAAAERAARMLREEQLEALAERRVGALSRGQAQRVAIARALIHDPALLLLDEPWTGLDPRAAVRLSERLAGLHAAGRSLVIVSHDLARVAGLATRALVLVRGRAAWLGVEALASETGLAPAYAAQVAALEARP
jgi:heme exporter protein A